MHVFEVQASSSSPRLPLLQISFLSRPPMLSYPMEKNRTLSRFHSLIHSLTQLLWCPGNRSFRFGIMIKANYTIQLKLPPFIFCSWLSFRLFYTAEKPQTWIVHSTFDFYKWLKQTIQTAVLQLKSYCQVALKVLTKYEMPYKTDINRYRQYSLQTGRRGSGSELATG